MSAHTRPDSAMAAVAKPRRIPMACVNCRAGKIRCISIENGQPCARCTKRRLECEYLAVPDEQALSGSTTDGRRRSRKPPPPSGPPSHMAPGWTQAPQGYGESGRGNQPQPSQDFFRPQIASQFNPDPGVPGPMTQPNRYPPQPQYPAGGDYIPSNYGGNAFQPPLPQLGHPSSSLPNQKPGVPEYPSEYQQYFANFGLNNVSYPADMFPGRCTCVPGGPCYCGKALWRIFTDLVVKEETNMS
ncbi:hypothetical protein FB451DRAFT_1173505 [Mycena latifolia]|nr:hypothetical protein FB451DRAFT_1173505 [Mycena latifolia]